MIGQNSNRPVTFRAQRIIVSEKVTISNLRWIHQINGSDPDFIVRWSIKGIYRLNVGQIPMIYMWMSSRQSTRVTS